MLRNLSKRYLFICCKQSSSTHFCHFLTTAFVTDVLAGSNPPAMGANKNGPLARAVSNSVVGDEGCPRAAGAARFRFVASLLACCAGKRFAFSQLRTLVGSNPSALSTKKKGPHFWEPIKSVVGDEGCRVRLAPPAFAAALARLACCAGKRFAFPQLRTLTGSNPSATGPNKNGPLSRTVSNSMVGDEGFEPPTLCV